MLQRNQKNRNTSSSTFLRYLLTNWVVTDPRLLRDIIQPKGTKYRNYQVQKDDDIKFIYLFGGRLRLRPNSFIALFSLVVIIIPAVLYWIFEASWQWRHLNPSLVIVFTYFWFLTGSFFIKVCTSDPGICPRNVHYPYELPGEDSNIKGNIPNEYFSVVTLPAYKNNKVGVSVKYCPTCHCWRPARTSHCSSCNVCVLNHDHHCLFIGNCIGYRNYKYFLWFLLCSVITSTILIVSGFLHVFHYKITDDSEIKSFIDSISKYPLTFFLDIYALITLSYPLLLLIVHLHLSSKNLTTRELLTHIYKSKKNSPEFVNVYDKRSIFKNLFITWVGRSSGISFLSMKEPYVTGDIRLEKIDPMQSFSKH